MFLQKLNKAHFSKLVRAFSSQQGSAGSAKYADDPWQPINGMGVADKTVKKWNLENMQKYQFLGDPLIDHTVEHLIKRGDQGWYRTFMRSSFTNEEMLPKEYPEALREYVNSLTLPDWVDEKKLQDGAHVFGKFAVPIASVLSWSSLSYLYCFPKAVEALARTGELTDNFGPRVLNTSRLVTSVGQPGAFGPKGNAIKINAKVRLTHGFVKYSILNSEEGWDTEKWNLPVNQMNKAWTLSTFSSLILDGLERLGADFEPYESEGYVHLWNVAGHILGIDHHLIPEDLEEAHGVLRYAAREFAGYSEKGVLAEKALLDYMKKTTPGELGDGVHEVFMFHLLGDKMCSYVGLQKTNDWTRVLLPICKKMMYLYDELGDRSQNASAVSGFLSRKMLEHIQKVMRQGKLEDFELAKKVEQQLKM